MIKMVKMLNVNIFNIFFTFDFYASCYGYKIDFQYKSQHTKISRQTQRVNQVRSSFLIWKTRRKNQTLSRQGHAQEFEIWTLVYGLWTQDDSRQQCTETTEKKGKLNFRGNEIFFRVIPFPKNHFSVHKIHDTKGLSIMYVYLQKTEIAYKASDFAYFCCFRPNIKTDLLKFSVS